ncbi:MAG: flavin reductase family protein [Thermoanaerobaculia bacterium]
MEFHPEALSVANRYKLLIGAIVPRPIALVSTISIDGVLNLAPFSFFNGVGSNPMTLLFCPGNRADGSEKDTLRNCKPVEEGGTGEFVVNAAIEGYARQIAAAAEDLERDQSEFDLVGLGTIRSRSVRPPRVAESPLAFECQTTEVIRTNPGRPAGGNVVLGRVVNVFIRDDLVSDRMHVDSDGLRAIGRMGGFGYTTTRDRFEIPPGREALDRENPFPSEDSDE